MRLLCSRIVLFAFRDKSAQYRACASVRNPVCAKSTWPYLAIYAYLLRIEDRRTYQCIVSYPTIARKLGISVNTVAKYVAALEEHGLIRTERTEIITKGGLKRNGCLRYTILPIKNALALCYERQLEKAGQAMERQRAQARAEKLGAAFTPAAGEQSA